MVTSALDIYNALLGYSANGETTICHLHKPCHQHPLCSSTSNIALQDFDFIEKKLATGVRSSLPSCDGVALNTDKKVFCFVEIKGWDKYVEFNIADVDNLSEEEKKKIDEQVSSYNLKGKLEQSIKDCEAITGQKDLFPSVPYVYIIVTDINSEEDALKDLATNLTFLSETATVWTYCDEKMLEALNDLDASVKKIYSHCRDFDIVIKQI